MQCRPGADVAGDHRRSAAHRNERERERRVEETKRILADNPMELAAYTDPDKEKYIEYGTG